MSSGTNTERITQNNTIISTNNGAIDDFKTAINNLPTRANLQSKTETITTNTTTTFSPDTGYDGLSSVEVTTNVPADLSPYFNSNISASKELIKGIPEGTVVTVANWTNMFKGYNLLENVPVLDTSNVTLLSNAFSMCDHLSNDSLNNIMRMCINATSYGGTTTLKYIGLSQTQAETCQTLSNWTAFTNAGWTTGY